MRSAQVLLLACSGLMGISAFLTPTQPRSLHATRRGLVMRSTEGESSRKEVLGAAALGALMTFLPTVASAKGVKRVKNGPIEKLENGITYQDMAIGSGASPKLGDRVAVHYSLYYNGFEVESSRESSGLAARPYGFNWGTETGPGAFPKGVQMGMEGMQIGGRRKITIPPELAYGKAGRPPFIPADATVLFDVSIWSIKPAGTNPNLTLGGQQNYF